MRFARFRARFVADLTHHGRAVGFFTTIAATLRARKSVADRWQRANAGGRFMDVRHRIVGGW
jgi:hypothetical protein